jgi:hypothetical protein
MVLAATPVAAQEVSLLRMTCYPMEEGREIVGQDGFSPLWWALSNNGTVNEVLADQDGQWLYALTFPTGMMCLVSAGTAFEHGVIEPAGEPM